MGNMYNIQPDGAFLTKVRPVVQSALERAESVLIPTKGYDVALYPDYDEFIAKEMDGASGLTTSDRSSMQSTCGSELK